MIELKQLQVEGSQENSTKQVVLVGNPNVGKSVIFSQLTGISQKVANYPGVTLHYLRGTAKLDDETIQIVDLPGLYGFVGNRTEELISQDFIIQNKPDLIINVIDGRRIEKNLALTLQLSELNIPMLLVVTFRDKTNQDISKLQRFVNLPSIAVNSHNTADTKNLKNFIFQSIHDLNRIPTPSPVDLGEYEEIIETIAEQIHLPIQLGSENNLEAIPLRWMVIQSILGGGSRINVFPPMVTEQVFTYIKSRLSIAPFDLRMGLIRKYYLSAEKLSRDVLQDQYDDQNSFLTRVDKVLLNPYCGFLIFVVSMTLMFVFTFFITEPINTILENMLAFLSQLITDSISNELIVSFLVDGVIGGVGFVLIFIPQIAIMFLFLGLMEQSGYMARVVFITDQFLGKLHISGTSIAPLLLGFGCNVAGIMATRSIRDENERITIGLVNPFLSCTARLPVFVVIASALFPKHAGLIVASLYFLGILIAIIFMLVLRNTILRGSSPSLILEVPELTRPNMKNVGLGVYRHMKNFVKRAATWMGMGLIFLWVLSITGPGGYIGPSGLDTKLNENWISFIGQLFAPIFRPMNWDTRLLIALILGFIAKEIVVGSLGILFGLSTNASLAPVLLTTFTPVSAYAFLVFVLLYTPCIGTYITLRHEFGKKWANFSLIISLVIAYVTAYLVMIMGSVITS